jgi:VWFA-related protein
MIRHLPMFVVAAGITAFAAVAWGQTPALQITAPQAEVAVVGTTRLAASLSSGEKVERVSFFVDGRLVCEPEAPPYGCTWDAGPAVRSHHVRVVAYLPGGQRLVANLHTKDVGYTERVEVDAVQVPVVVMNGGQFVRGLASSDFALAQDGVPQRIESLASEDVPLDLVLAIDISGSMGSSMDEVKAAVKQLLAQLRPGDYATLVGFNDSTFLVAERETDQRAREDAVDLLASWGGTSLYDATIRAVDMVRRERGRKGVVIFSDGEDRHSIARREDALARVQSSDAMLFTVAFGRGASVPALRQGLERYARATGGRAFFARTPKELDRVFAEVVEELANQYMLSYVPRDLQHDGSWHTLKVKVRNGKYQVRAREGFRAPSRRRSGGER